MDGFAREFGREGAYDLRLKEGERILREGTELTEGAERDGLMDEFTEFTIYQLRFEKNW
jgi:hypothetical protein